MITQFYLQKKFKFLYTRSIILLLFLPFISNCTKPNLEDKIFTIEDYSKDFEELKTKGIFNKNELFLVDLAVIVGCRSERWSSLINDLSYQEILGNIERNKFKNPIISVNSPFLDSLIYDFKKLTTLKATIRFDEIMTYDNFEYLNYEVIIFNESNLSINVKDLSFSLQEKHLNEEIYFGIYELEKTINPGLDTFYLDAKKENLNHNFLIESKRDSILSEWRIIGENLVADIQFNLSDKSYPPGKNNIIYSPFATVKRGSIVQE